MSEEVSLLRGAGRETSAGRPWRECQSWRSLARVRMNTSRSWPSLRGPITNTFGGSARVHAHHDQIVLDGTDTDNYLHRTRSARVLCSTPLVAKIMVSDGSLPAASLVRPPASSTNSCPAARSQMCVPCS